jgi:hypothetical protein
MSGRLRSGAAAPAWDEEEEPRGRASSLLPCARTRSGSEFLPPSMQSGMINALVPLWYRPLRPFRPDHRHGGTLGTRGRSGTHLHLSPLGWGPKGRWFKSSRPDFFSPVSWYPDGPRSPRAPITLRTATTQTAMASTTRRCPRWCDLTDAGGSGRFTDAGGSGRFTDAAPSDEAAVSPKPRCRSVSGQSPGWNLSSSAMSSRSRSVGFGGGSKPGGRNVPLCVR